MNERIKEIEKQCYGYASLHDDTIVFDKEKFAELIVAECVNMIEAEAEKADEDSVHGMRNAAGLISRAFITFRS
jgi:hypothetical protein